MDATGRGEDMAVFLGITQQFNPLLQVGGGHDVGAFDGFQCDSHHVTIVTLKQQSIAGDDIVLDDEMNKRLLIIVAVTE